jgi:hypothetical protein
VHVQVGQGAVKAERGRAGPTPWSCDRMAEFCAKTGADLRDSVNSSAQTPWSRQLSGQCTALSMAPTRLDHGAVTGRTAAIPRVALFSTPPVFDAALVTCPCCHRSASIFVPWIRFGFVCTQKVLVSISGRHCILTSDVTNFPDSGQAMAQLRAHILAVAGGTRYTGGPGRG